MKQSPFTRGLIFVLAAILLAGGLIFVNQIAAGDVFNKEEAQHALYGLWLWRDISVLDWGAFLYDTGRQMVWPFLHSWILSIFFFIFGVSYTTARLLSLILFMGSIVLVYFLSAHFSKRLGPRIGVVSVMLALTSPIMLRFAAENMLEGLGAFLFLSAVYTYVICEERKITLEYVLLAFLVGLSIYTNYMYAYLMIPAFLVMTITKLGPIYFGAIRLKRKGEKKAMRFFWWAYRKLIVLFVFLLLTGIWFSFSFSRKLLLLFASIFKYSGGVRLEGWGQVLSYYPKVIIQYLSFSPWLGVFLLLSLFMPFIANRYRLVNKLYIFVWTVLGLLALTIPAKAPQMLYIVVPFIFMIFSAAFFFVLEKVQSKNMKLAGALVLILVLPAMLSLPRAYGLFFPARGSENMGHVLDYFMAVVPKGEDVIIPINLQRLNPEVVEFHFKDWQAPVLTDMQRDPFSESEMKGYFLSVELDEQSRYQADVVDDSLYRWNAWLQDKLMNGDVRLFSSRRFEQAGITAKIYSRVPSSI